MSRPMPRLANTTQRDHAGDDQRTAEHRHAEHADQQHRRDGRDDGRHEAEAEVLAQHQLERVDRRDAEQLHGVPDSRSRTNDSAVSVTAMCWSISASAAGAAKPTTLGWLGATLVTVDGRRLRNDLGRDLRHLASPSLEHVRLPFGRPPA